MEKIVEINDKEYICDVAITDNEKIEGLQGVKELPKDRGMLFVYEKPQTVKFWMYKTEIPLDIIFISEDEEVISIYKGMPNSREMAEEDNVLYVLELNQNSGVNEGDEVDIEDDEEFSLSILLPNGKTQMELEGGERIFSRNNTKHLIKLVKKAKSSKLDKDYKKIGKTILHYLDIQNSNDPEYVTK